MSAKTPIRTVFNASDVATGLAEYQSGEFIPLSHGGIGAALSIGTAGQILKVNSGASALEFGDVTAIVNIDAATDGSSATLAASDKFLFSDGGTEKYLLASQIDTYVSGTSSTLTNKTLTAPTINGVVGGTTTSQTISTLTTATINASSHLGVDSGGTITLDADSGSIDLADGGTTFGTLVNSSGNLIIKSGSTTAITMSGANVTVAGDLTVSGTTTTVDSSTINIQNAFVFEGATADAHETTLTTVDPTADRTISLPNATGTIVLKDTTDTLTNKTLTAPIINAATVTGVVHFSGASPLVFEGATTDAYETTFTITDPTADRTVTIQDASGTVAYLTDITGGGASEFSTVTVNTSVIFEGATDDGYETTLVVTDPTADRTITLPNVSGTLPVLAAASNTQITSTPEELNLLDGVSGLVQADFTKLAAVNASATELNYVDGVTSAIQTQIDANTTLANTKASQAFAIAQAVALG
jgi:hypothetical protein